ncbi:hypothetical protein HK407_07g11870 [Ordospora pajunii]|uniref:uncharacterized protein n=1 Tax=Ordospora pajunii TaxID=3039483 RepID=UPI00295288B5|nr:uncharacterized protein HK407_07g11870 [Ordospora pajunii]KAH9411195.1 hypothetical protein HK407_07g11870 [Ordospora pajunii]
MSSQGNDGNAEYLDIFKSLVEDIGECALSIQLTNFEDVNLLYETTGRCSLSLAYVETHNEKTWPKDIEYDGKKYIFMRSISDDSQTSLIFISVSVDSDEIGRKRGMLLTQFCGILKLIITFDYQNVNNATAKIFKVLESYTSEE